MQRVIGRIDGIGQELLIEQAVLEHLARHRQINRWSSEAGGQLFGSVDPDRICISEATGPYRGDERSRYQYRSNPRAAQRAIDEHAARGLLYLGEWHTHAEDHPKPSGLDNDAMVRLLANSNLKSNSLLMLIGGRAPGVDGLAALTVSRNAVHLWLLQEWI